MLDNLVRWQKMNLICRKDHALRGYIAIDLLRQALDPESCDRPRLLSVACSTGVFEAEMMSDLTIPVYGIDGAPKSLAKAKEREVIAACTDVSESFPFKSGSFQMVFAGEIIEHIFDTRVF